MSAEKEKKKAETDWAAAQSRLWESWVELGRKAASQTPGTVPPPLSNALEGWWRAVAPQAAGGAQGPVVDRLLGQGKAFLGFGELMSGLMERLQQQGARAAEAGTDPYAKLFETLRGQDQSRLWAFWENPAEQWKQMASQFTTLPGDLFQGEAARQQGGMHSLFSRPLEAPGLGYTREWQEQAQQAGRLWLEYQKASKEYSDLLGQVNRAAVERLTARLQAQTQAGEPVDSLRGLYDLWVDCSEEAYAEVVQGPEYAQRHGRMLNTLMAWKQKTQEITEELAEAAGLPTRRELSTAHQRLQELRREVSALREIVGELQARLDGGATATPPARKARTSTTKSAATRTRRTTRKAPESSAPESTGGETS